MSPFRSKTPGRLFRFLSRSLLLVAGLSGAPLASAQLLGVEPGLPLLNFNNTGRVNYDAANDTLAVDADPISILIPPPAFAFAFVNAPSDVLINIEVDDTGALVGGVPGDDLVVTGAVQPPGPALSGVLLTGEIVAFGSRDSGGPTDFYDFRFVVTGGALAPFYAGQEIGVVLTSEGSTFTGSFTVNFAGDAKGNIGPVPPGPPEPEIDIEKFTNGYDGDGANGAAAATPPNGPFTPGDPRVAQVSVPDSVVWTYRVTNTGGEDLVNIVVTDPTGTAQGAVVLCPGTGNNTIPNLAVGASVDCTASLPGGARDLDLSDPDVVPGCGDGRPTYENTGEVVGSGEFSNTPVGDIDDSHYCNPEGDVDLEKFTNGHDGDDADGTPTTTPPDGPFTPGANEVAQVAVGGPVIWTYRVRNTGTSNLVDLVVTDAAAAAQGAPIVCPGTSNDTIPFLAVNGVVDCTATLPGGALDLQFGLPDVLEGCGDGRPTYENTGEVAGFIEFTTTAVGDSDDSHYCNPPPRPDVEIIKFTNDQDANDPDGLDVPRIAPGGTVTWTYRVTNTGNTAVAFNDVLVTDDQPGVIPVFHSVLVENGAANVFDPGDEWLYTADLPAENLENPSPGVIVVEDSCTANGQVPPSTAYTNIGTVTIPGATDADPSSYCNPLEPDVELEKFTNGHDGDNANGTPTTTPPPGLFAPGENKVAQVAESVPVVWTYRVRNTGTENLINITVSDPRAAAQGASIACPGNNPLPFLAIGASVDCTATLPGGARKLVLGEPDVVPGCGDARPTYMNTGVVAAVGETSGEPVGDTDDSHYCNPLIPDVEIIKFTNGQDANDPDGTDVPRVVPADTVTWTYRVTNTGDVAVPFAQVLVTDDQPDVFPAFDSVLVENGAANIFDPGDVWLYTAGLPAENLLLPGPGVITQLNSCTANGAEPPRTAYTNIGTVTIPGATDEDPSSYCNPPDPRIDIEKVTNSPDNQNVLAPDFDNEDLKDGAGVPVVPVSSDIVWTYRVINTGNVGFARDDVLVQDTVAGLNPLTLVDDGNGDNVLSPGEIWLYEAIGTSLDLLDPPSPLPAGVIIVADGCSNSVLTSGGTAGPAPTYRNDGTVTWRLDPAVTDTDRSHYCNPPPASLGDYVWNDLNANGIQDDGETGINGVTVQLLSCEGDVLGTTVTGAGGPNDQSGDANGFYEFTGLVPGCYKVSFETPAGFVVSPRQQGGNPALDSDGLESDEVTLSSGGRDATLDAGFYQPASLGDYVWNDLNANGVQDDGETGINGVTVRLLSCEGDVLDTTVTGAGGPNDQSGDANGFYEFTGLVPGCYKVSFETPAGFVVSPRQQGGNPALDSDGLESDEVTLSSGGRDATLDAGFYQPASLGDYVWNDLNANGVQDDGETGINGVTVRLLSCEGDVLGTTVTGAGGPNDQSGDANGFYEFTGLVPGCYKVSFETPAGFVVSPRQQGGNPALDSDGLDSDEVTLASGERDATLDSGFYQPASLGDYVWNDLNANGIQDDGETGINGVTVQLLSCEGDVLDTTSTGAGGPNDQSNDPNGFYEFTGLVPGCYKVSFETPAGFVVSPRQQGGNPALDSDGLDSDEVTLTSGGRDATLDSGFYRAQCELSVSKTCLIPEPPTSDLTGKCKGKIQEWTVIWPMGQPQITLSGLPNDAPGGIVNPGQEVTFFNPGGSANDVFVDISGGMNGESKFHLSCSDKDMNADNDNDVQQQLQGKAQDCGKFAGNGKSSSGFINDWVFEGLVDAENKELDCTAAPPEFPTEPVQCEFTPQPGAASCDAVKPVDGLIMVWNGTEEVDVVAYDGSVGGTVLAQIDGVKPGDVVTVQGMDGSPNDQQWEIFLAGTNNKVGESEFHISCSDDNMDGPEDCPIPQGNGKDDDPGFVNTWGFGGIIGEGGTFTCPGVPGVSDSADVTYGITVDNLNDEAITVNIVDALLGIDETETIPANAVFKYQTDPITITPDGTGTDPFDPDVYKNTVVVTGVTASGAICEAMDMVQVKRNPPPPEPPLLGKCSGKLQEVVVLWNGTDSVDVTPGNGVSSLSAAQVAPGDVLTIFPDGSTNDVFIDISDSVRGESKFHISCSDRDMNAADDDQDQDQLAGESQDCGKFQGNAKSTSGFINTWLLEGMLDAQGLRLSCDFDPASLP